MQKKLLCCLLVAIFGLFLRFVFAQEQAKKAIMYCTTNGEFGFELFDDAKAVNDFRKKLTDEQSKEEEYWKDSGKLGPKPPKPVFEKLKDVTPSEFASERHQKLLENEKKRVQRDVGNIRATILKRLEANLGERIRRNDGEIRETPRTDAERGIPDKYVHLMTHPSVKYSYAGPFKIKFWGCAEADTGADPEKPLRLVFRIVANFRGKLDAFDENFAKKIGPERVTKTSKNEGLNCSFLTLTDHYVCEIRPDGKWGEREVDVEWEMLAPLSLGAHHDGSLAVFAADPGRFYFDDVEIVADPGRMPYPDMVKSIKARDKDIQKLRDEGKLPARPKKGDLPGLSAGNVPNGNFDFIFAEFVQHWKPREKSWMTTVRRVPGNRGAEPKADKKGTEEAYTIEKSFYVLCDATKYDAQKFIMRTEAIKYGVNERLLNGDFQADWDDDGHPDDWAGSWQGKRELVREGKNWWMLLRREGENDKRSEILQDVKTPPDVVATILRYRMRLNDTKQLKAGSDRAFGRIIYYDAENKVAENRYPPIIARDGTTDWIVYERIYPVHKGAVKAKVQLVQWGLGEAEFDDVELIPVGKDAPLYLAQAPLKNADFGKDGGGKGQPDDWSACEFARVVKVKNDAWLRIEKENFDPELTAAIQKVAPGWQVSNSAAEMDKANKCGVVGEHEGKKDVVLTHPPNPESASVLTRKVAIPKDGKVKLKIVVGHHKDGDWTLVVRIDGKELFQKAVGKATARGGWVTEEIDLSSWAGKEVKIQILNKASGWNFEGAYWAEIKLDGLPETKPQDGKSAPGKDAKGKDDKGAPAQPESATIRQRFEIDPQWEVVNAAVRMKVTDVQKGSKAHHAARMLVYFKTGEGKLTGHQEIASKTGTEDWKVYDKDVRIPRDAVQGIVEIGIWEEGSGIAEFDDIRIVVVEKEYPWAEPDEPEPADKTADTDAQPK